MQSVKLLFRIFIFSFLVTIMLTFTYRIVAVKSKYDGHLTPLIFAGSFFLNLLLTIVAGPGIILSRKSTISKLQSFAICLFTPLTILICIIFSGLQKGDMGFYLIAVCSFILVSGFFLFKRLAPTNAIIGIEDAGNPN